MSQDTGAGAFSKPDQEYRLGPEDVLEVSVWKNPDLSQTEAVRPDGKVALKLVGEVPAAGMSVAELRRYLTEKYRDFVPEAEVSVTIKEINSFRVYVLGRVAKPGEYRSRSALTILQALAMAGGLTPYARDRSILVLRQVDGKERTLVFNYRRVLQGKSGDLELRPGDRVLVP